MNGIDRDKWIEADRIEMNNIAPALRDEYSGLNKPLNAPVFPTYMDRKIKKYGTYKSRFVTVGIKNMIKVMTVTHILLQLVVK